MGGSLAHNARHAHSLRSLILVVAGLAALGLTAFAVGSVAAVRAADPAALPPGDGKVSTTAAKRGYVFSCGGMVGGGGPQAAGSWVHGTTWDSTAKITVDGAVAWKSVRRIVVTGAKRSVTGNGLPSHRTGVFPVATTDDAYAIDRNPNSIAAQSGADSLLAAPVAAAKPSCIGGGPIGVMLTGAVLFNALDAEGRDAPAHEVLDRCGGHPERSGAYHYHSLSPCLAVGTATTEHSPLVGYALDGFDIYGPRGDGGKLLSTADLDACHGTTDTISWNGKQVRIYHCVLTADYPYSRGCYRGTPVRTRGTAGGGGPPGPGAGLPGLGPPPGGGPGAGGPPLRA